MTINNNDIHLCNSCCSSVADCGAENIVFGDGQGEDNIAACSNYCPLLEHDCDRGGYK